MRLEGYKGTPLMGYYWRDGKRLYGERHPNYGR